MRRAAGLLALFAALLLLLWWQQPYRFADAQFRPPPLLALRLDGAAMLPGLAPPMDAPMDAMVRRSRGVSATVLAAAIRHSASEALRDDMRKVPPELAEALAQHYGRDLVASVRWTVRGRRLELGSLLTAWVLEEGAVTLDRVIVFDNAALADNLWLWAHELAHVEQYKRLGVEGFAAAYVADWQGMEAEAITRANAVVAAIRAAQEAAPVRWLRTAA